MSGKLSLAMLLLLAQNAETFSFDSCFRPLRTFPTATNGPWPAVRCSSQLYLAGSNDNDDPTEEEQAFNFLLEIASKLKLEIFDLEEGIYGYDCKDLRYGLEVVQTSIDLTEQAAGLGLVLTEMASAPDGRGLVLISQVTGNAAKANPPIQVGDAISGIRAGGQFRERVTGANYDVTVQEIGKAKEIAMNSDQRIFLELNRLVERARITVQVDREGKSEAVEIDALAGENLRRLLMRKGIKLYDRKTKRFDMPFASGDCAGEGLCGTCLVAVNKGADLLSPMDNTEKLIMQGRPLSWRASCRTVVGGNNQPGTIMLSTQPQSRFEDELDPGVRSLDL
ncbi:2Fe-2S iron-sulfur cluster binding domain [Seminavis robusta]|uniref:2Fe-2S iron-sulfur cluster binding domain n=1 Tax=Seminavis robusta TaxID=568900 RepID=A0A9N8DKE2_9STRA|nr:2Fe-2S iron-sulfur cluster binding domain [Seminavis robusta]|eukprot:Sro190_g081820.1 2Fe-2S iron-sulfur cluster binding domain (337) ;mRNA; r:37206-38216